MKKDGLAGGDEHPRAAWPEVRVPGDEEIQLQAGCCPSGCSHPGGDGGDDGGKEQSAKTKKIGETKDKALKKKENVTAVLRNQMGKKKE